VEKGKTQRELEALVKSTEEMRAHLQKTWEKVENLDAAIQSAESTRAKVNARPSKINPRK
jgi:hypothetical protein